MYGEGWSGEGGGYEWVGFFFLFLVDLIRRLFQDLKIKFDSTQFNAAACGSGELELMSQKGFPALCC